MSEKAELKKRFNMVINDLLDNYENYTKEEQERIHSALKELAVLNLNYEKYDVDKKSLLEKITEYFAK